jgi:hypothetical protein
MKRASCLAAPLVFVAAINFAGLAIASEESKAEQICTDKIKQVSGIHNLRHVWSEQIGNHKFRVHGKAVPGDGHKWVFDCKVKRGHLKSYNYPGPKHHAKDDDSNLGTALAVGAGLAIVAALVASADDDGSAKSTTPQPRKSFLEDDCLERLQYRVRDEHRHAARVHLNNSRVNGHDLVGEAKVRYDHTGHHATYTCHFDRHWRLKDSSYYLY